MFSRQRCHLTLAACQQRLGFKKKPFFAICFFRSCICRFVLIALFPASASLFLLPFAGLANICCRFRLLPVSCCRGRLCILPCVQPKIAKPLKNGRYAKGAKTNGAPGIAQLKQEVTAKPRPMASRVRVHAFCVVLLCACAARSLIVFLCFCCCLLCEDMYCGWRFHKHISS